MVRRTVGARRKGHRTDKIKDDGHSTRAADAKRLIQIQPWEANSLIKLTPGRYEARPDDRKVHRLRGSPARTWKESALVSVLIAVAIAVGNCHASATPRVTAYGWESSTRISQKNNGGEHWHHGKSNETEFRKWISTKVPNPSPDECEKWSDKDQRVGVFHPIEGAGVLIIGRAHERNESENRIGIKNPERHYFAESFGKGGAPLQGSISIRIQPEGWPGEQGCLKKLLGMWVEWTHIEKGSSDAARAVEMKVTDIRFARAAKLGPNGETMPTGETMATVTMAESWMAMAHREMRAQRWGIAGGIAGSACLMVLTWAGNRIWWHLRRREGREQVKRDRCECGKKKGREEPALLTRAKGAPKQVEQEGHPECGTEVERNRRGTRRRQSGSRKSGREGSRKRRRHRK